MRITNYLISHLQASINTLKKLSHTPFASLMTCLIIGIALALPLTLFVALKNTETINGSFQQTMQLTLYLKKNISTTQVLALTHTLQKQTNIKQARAISPADGLKELQKQAGFNGVTEQLQNNPLPWVIVVLPNKRLHKPADFEALSQYLKRLPQVDYVQLDLLWVKRLETFITVAHRITNALAIFLGIAVLLIINNTIRSATQQHHKEIEIIQLIGGTNNFIRRPFLYAGMAYGLAGGVIAWVLVETLVLFLKAPMEQLAHLYESPFQLLGMGLTNTMILFLASILLGLAGSWFAVTKHLYQSTI